MCACQQHAPEGQLLVHAPESGTFEIYRIESEQPLQVTSEQLGEFNRPLGLQEGSYLILADCSGQIAVIKAGRTEELVVHRLEFKTPVKAEPEDLFQVQCTRFEKFKFRQTIVNRYFVNIFSNGSEMLVGMLPYAPDVLASGDSDGLPKRLSLDLAAISVTASTSWDEQSKFFVSPKEDRLSLTTEQKMSHRIYVIGGRYEVALNGTSTEVSLQPNEIRNIVAGTFRVNTPGATRLDLAFQIRGNPIFVEINAGHWLNLNQDYHVMPGPLRYNIVDTDAQKTITIVEGERQIIEARSLQVNFDCSPWEWPCLGNKKVFLYVADQGYPFASGVSEVPIVFDETDVWLSVEGSRNIRVQIPNDQRHTLLKGTQVIIRPDLQVKNGQSSDLLRMEASSPGIDGVSLDIPLEEESVMPLVEGSYQLSSYHTVSGPEGVRKKSVKFVRAVHRDQQVIEPVVFITDKRFQWLRSKGLLPLEPGASAGSSEPTSSHSSMRIF